MNVRMVRGTVALVLVFLTMSVFADNERKAAGFGAKHGASQYEISGRERGTVAFTILGSDGTAIAHARLQGLEGNGVRLDAKTASKEKITIVSDLANGRVSVTVDGATAVKQLNDAKTAFDASGAAYLFDTHARTLELLAAAMTDLTTLLGEPPTSDFTQDPGPGGGDGTAACNGGSFRGWGMGSARSFACASATNDANIQCWNRYCIGCCRFAECDAVCALGDYGCSAGRTGWSCSAY